MTPHESRPSPLLLITSGPTWEPIDEVRYLGNRSSGRLGAALADAAADRGWDVLVLLGPQAAEPSDTSVNVVRFQTAADLQAALAEHAPRCDALVMAAAVADYRPAACSTAEGKIKRTADDMTLRLEPIPDLIAGEAKRKRADQCYVAFALEPRERLFESAARKLEKKGVDAIVANPLETMGADVIEASFLTPSGVEADTGGPIKKSDFAGWLLDRIADRLTPEGASVSDNAEA